MWLTATVGEAAHIDDRNHAGSSKQAGQSFGRASSMADRPGDSTRVGAEVSHRSSISRQEATLMSFPPV
jgi:hypothetical protein